MGNAVIRTNNFNFHHRVVETVEDDFKIMKEIVSLTFTIGWLKRIKFGLAKNLDLPLTFTIGWLKRIKFGLAKNLDLPLTFTIGWLKPFQ